MMLKIVGCCKIVIIIKYPAWIYDFQDIQQKTIQDGIKQDFTIWITNELEPQFEEELYHLTLFIPFPILKINSDSMESKKTVILQCSYSISFLPPCTERLTSAHMCRKSNCVLYYSKIYKKFKFLMSFIVCILYYIIRMSI